MAHFEKEDKAAVKMGEEKKQSDKDKEEMDAAMGRKSKSGGGEKPGFKSEDEGSGDDMMAKVTKRYQEQKIMADLRKKGEKDFTKLNEREQIMLLYDKIDIEKWLTICDPCGPQQELSEQQLRLEQEYPLMGPARE